MKLFSGLSAFPITPMTSAGEVIVPDLQELVRRIEAGGADSIGLLGSTGTYMFLTREERRRAVAAAIASASYTPVIVGVGALRTDDAQALAADAADEGAAGLLLAPVSYTPLTDEEVFQHFAAVASATSLPICIYSNPGTTNFTFSPRLVGRLAAIPTIAAIKLPLPPGDVGSDLGDFRRAAPRLTIGYSGDWGCKEALLAGADGWFSVVGGLFPERAAALTAAAMAKDPAGADTHNEAFGPLWELCKTVGSVRVMYAAANALGLTRAQPPRPLLGLSPADQEKLAALLPT